MKDLKQLLEAEKERYINSETVLRMLLPKRWHIPLSPNEQEIQDHLDQCRNFFEENHSIHGFYSPWIEAFNDDNHFSKAKKKVY